MADDLTKEQREEIAETFKWFDKNADGLINEEELCLALRVAGYNPTNAQTKEMIEAVDSDKDGKINLEEFIKMMAEKVLKTDEREKLRDAFKVFDKNGDGKICAKELRTALASVGEPLSENEVSELIRRGDIDKNGMLCYEEFVILMTEIHPNGV